MRKEIFHDNVKIALQKDRQHITLDPDPLRYDIADVYIDLAAETELRKIVESIKITISGKLDILIDTALAEHQKNGDRLQ